MDTEEQTITYAELRDGDVILDKSGNRWNVDLPGIPAPDAPLSFWLGTAANAHAHFLTKPPTDEVTVIRPVSHVTQVEALEAEMPTFLVENDGVHTPTITELPKAVETVTETLGAETIATETADEADARTKAALTGIPVDLPKFEEMTPLEMHSHLYLLHGVYAYDVKVPAELTTLHDETHRNPVASKTVAHVHAGEA